MSINLLDSQNWNIWGILIQQVKEEPLTAIGLLIALIAIGINLYQIKLGKKQAKKSDSKDMSSKFPFAVYDGSTTKLQEELIHKPFKLPYIPRWLDDKQKSFETSLESGNILLHGRSGLGKTREIVELIKRLHLKNGEENTILRIKNHFHSDFVIDSDMYSNNAILLIDDLEKKINAFEELNSSSIQSEEKDFFTELDKCISKVGSSFDSVKLVFSSRKENNRGYDWHSILKVNSAFWNKYDVKFIPLPDIKKNGKNFIEEVAKSEEIKLSNKAVKWILNNWDGTCSAIISALKILKEKHKGNSYINETHVEETFKDFGLTYPIKNWKNIFLGQANVKSNTEIELLKAFVALQTTGTPFFTNLVYKLTFNKNKFKQVFFKKAYHKTLKKLDSWIFEFNDELVIPNIYISQIGDEYNSKDKVQLIWSLLIDEIPHFSDIQLNRLDESFWYKFNKVKNDSEELDQFFLFYSRLIIEKKPSHLLIKLSQAYLAIGEYSLADEYLKMFTLENPNNFQALLVKISIESKTNGIEKAISLCSNLKPSSNQILRVKKLQAYLYSSASKYEQAITIFKDILNEEPFNGLVKMSLAICEERLLFSGKFSKAKFNNQEECKVLEIGRLYNEVLSSDTENPKHWQTLLVFYIKTNQPEKFSKLFNKFVNEDLDPEDILTIMQQLAVLAYKVDTKTSSELYLQINICIFKQTQDLGDALHITSHCLSIDNRKLAKQFFFKAINLNPQDERVVYYFHNLFSKNRIKDVIVSAEWLLESYQNEEIFKFLGQAYFKIGEIDKAYKAWKNLEQFEKYALGAINVIKCLAELNKQLEINRLLEKSINSEGFIHNFHPIIKAITSTFFKNSNYINTIKYGLFSEDKNLKRIIKFSYSNIKEKSELFEFENSPLFEKLNRKTRVQYYINLINLAFSFKDFRLVESSVLKLEIHEMSAKEFWICTILCNNFKRYNETEKYALLGLESIKSGDEQLEACIRRAVSYSYSKTGNFNDAINELNKIPRLHRKDKDIKTLNQLIQKQENSI